MSIHTARTDKFTKHVGVCKDKRVAVVLQLPEEPDMVHVVDTDALPDEYHAGLMNIINSPEGQAARWLGEVLHRRPLADGKNALRTFYERNLIHKVPVDQVTLTPFPNKTVPLTDVLAQFADPLSRAQTAAQPVAGQELDQIVAEEQRKLDESVATDSRHNQHVENLAGDQTNNNKAIANNLIAEAEMLEAEAQRKRNLANTYSKKKAK